MSAGKFEDLEYIDAAARKIGMDRQRFRAICIGCGVAIRWGGTEKHPRLKVSMSEAKNAIMAQRYRLPQKHGTTTKATRQAVACDDVRC